MVCSTLNSVEPIFLEREDEEVKDGRFLLQVMVATLEG